MRRPDADQHVIEFEMRKTNGVAEGSIDFQSRRVICGSLKENKVFSIKFNLSRGFGKFA